MTKQNITILRLFIVYICFFFSEDDTNFQDVMQEANSMLRRKYKIEQTTIQVEKYDAVVMQKCDQCLMLKA